MDININPSFVSLIGIIFGFLGANSIILWNKNKSLGLTGNSIVGVFSSVLFIKIVGRLFHLELGANILVMVSILIGSFIVGLSFVLLTKKVLLKYNITKYL